MLLGTIDFEYLAKECLDKPVVDYEPKRKKEINN